MAKSTKTETKDTSTVGLLTKIWESFKKTIQPGIDFMKVGDVCSIVLGLMITWLACVGVISFF